MRHYGSILPIALVLATATGWAQSNGELSTPTLTALLIELGEVKLDGLLSEPVWQLASVGTGFVQREPGDGIPATERTEVRVLYGPGVIFVGVRAFDSEPELIRSELVRRDRPSQSDEISIYFDSYHDRRTAFQFTVNPSGSFRDVYHFNDTAHNRDSSWDPVWQVETSIDSLGWTAEFRIPLTQLRFNEKGTTWGFQVYRRIQRKAETVYWSPYLKEASGFASLFGTLQGLNGLSQPMRLELRPYTVVNSRHRPVSTGSLYAPTQDADFAAGFDVQYGLTSDFTLNLTVNPDFGQVEADPSVINLSAFETFFPEKRPFFVEGSGLFNRFVPAGQLFYSRRIGRRPQGWADPPESGTVQIPERSTIFSAAKVTGKTSRGLGLGLLSALTAREVGVLRDSTGAVVGSRGVEPFSHYFTGRIEQDFADGSSTLGGMVTAVNRNLSANLNFLRSAAYMGELDGQLRWQENTYAVRWQFAASHIRGSPEAITIAQRSPFRYYQRPDATHVELDTTRTSLSGYTLRLEAGKEAGTWQYSGSYERTSPGFDITDAGFQWWADGQAVFGWAQYLQAQPTGIFRDFRISIAANRWWDTAGSLFSTWLRPVLFNARFKNNWSLTLNPIAFGTERLTNGLRGGPLLRDDPWHNSFINITTDRRKTLALSVWAEAGGNNATRGEWYGINPTLFIRPSGMVNGSLSLDYWSDRNPRQWVTAETIDDSTHYVGAEIEQQSLSLTARLNWSFTRDLSIQFYAQPFVSAGSYSAFIKPVEPRADDFDDRYDPYEDLTCAEGDCEVDLDSDGNIDFTFGQPDFNFRQLRATLVFRWEYRPGSVVFFAWQHGRSAFVNDGRFGDFGDITSLFREASDNTLLIKLNYWINF